MKKTVMENDILKVLTVINQTANALYPNKYVVTVSNSGNPGLYYPEAKRIVSPIAFGDDGSVLFFNNCNDLMDDFIAIENEVNHRLEKLNLNLSLNENQNHNENKDYISDDTEPEPQDNFYVLKLGNWFMSSGIQLIKYPDPKLTDNLKYALMFTDDDMEDDFKDAVEYYLDKGFKLCKINFEEV